MIEKQHLLLPIRALKLDWLGQAGADETNSQKVQGVETAYTE